MSRVTKAPSWAGAKQENLELLNFVAEKAEFVKSPFNIKNICREFQMRVRSMSSESSLSSKLMRYRKRIHELKEFDTDTKVRILYALSAPIDGTFLKELQEQAEIQLDAHGRITKYHKKTGGLDLKGEHSFHGTPNSTERDMAMMKILAEKSKKMSCPMTDISFVREFKEQTDDTNSECYLRRVFSYMKNQIFTSNDYDNATKIKMIFVSSAVIPKSVLEEIRKEATVEVDDDLRITRYESNDGSLKLSGRHSVVEKREREKRTKRKRMGPAYLGEYGKLMKEREMEMQEAKVVKKRYYNVGSKYVKTRSQRVREEEPQNSLINYQSPYVKYHQSYENPNENQENIVFFDGEPYYEDAEEIQYYPDFPVPIKQETQMNQFEDEIPLVNNSLDSQYATSPSEESLRYLYHDGSSTHSDTPEIPQLPFSLHIKEEEENAPFDATSSVFPILDTKPLLFDVKQEIIDFNTIPDENFLNFINNDDQFFLFPNESEDSSSSSSNPDSISLIEFLSIFRDLTEEIGLKELQDEISTKIVQLEPRNLHVTINSILLALDSALPVITKSTRAPGVSSINLNEFLRLLKNATTRMNSTQFQEFHQELDEMCKDEENRNISHETIRHGLDHALDIILPLF